MKKLKYFLFSLLILFCFNINVKAEEYAYCYYNYTGNFRDNPIYSNGLGWEKELTMIMQVAYHSEKTNPPNLAVKILKKSLGNNYKFSKNYEDEFSMDSYSYGINGGDDIWLEAFDPVLTWLKDDGKLVCPDIYLFYSHFDRNGKKNGQYKLSFTDDETLAGTFDYKNVVTITPDKNETYIKNSSSENENTDVSIECRYKYIKGDGSVEFDILKNGNVSNITSTGELYYKNFIFDNDNNYNNTDKVTDIKTCPNYIKIEEHTTFVDKKYVIKIVDSNSDATAVYVGDRFDAGDNTDETNGKVYARYVVYDKSKRSIVFVKDGSNVIAKLNKDDEVTTIMIKNFESYKKILETGIAADYPRYIIESVDNGIYSYEFSDYSDSKANDSYINLHHVAKLGDSSITKTCRSLLGSSFLDFLNSNVLKVVYIGIPILLIVLTTFDFAKVVFIDDKEGISSAGKKFGKRVIAAFLIYLVPTILILGSNIFANNEISKCAKTLKDLTETIDN